MEGNWICKINICKVWAHFTISTVFHRLAISKYKQLSSQLVYLLDKKQVMLTSVLGDSWEKTCRSFSYLAHCHTAEVSPARGLLLEAITVSTRKNPVWVSGPCLSLQCWWIKKYFARKCGKAVAKIKTVIYEISSDSSQQYSNTDIVHRACERKLVSCECSCKQSVWGKGMA